MKTKTSVMLREQGLEKEANAVDSFAKAYHESPDVKNIVNWGVSAGLLGAGAGMFSAIKAKMEQGSVRRHIVNMGKSFKSDPMFSDNADKAKARLYEIARVAPHVTLNTELTKSIIKSKLHNGLTDEDKQNLVMIQAQYHQDPKVSGYMPKVASAQLGEILADAIMVKEAGFSDSMKTYGALAMLPIASGIIGGAINMGLAHLKQKSIKEGLEKSFVKALSLSDMDKEPLMQNKDKAREAFATLARFAPQVALDPQAARAFMNKIVSYDQGIDVSSVKELSEISKNLNASNQVSPFGEGFATTAKFIGAPKIMATGMTASSADVMKSLRKQ